MNATIDPMQRLAAYRTEIDEGVRERHLAQMGEALRAAPTTAAPTRLGFRRRFATALAALTIVVVPVGAAVAAESSVPGEGLYPVKRVTENMRGWVDHDLIATHRVEELEVLLDRDADDEIIAETADRATIAVAELDDPGELGPRLEQAQERIRLRSRQRIRGGLGSSSSESSGPVIGPAPAPGNPDSPATEQPPGSGPGEPPEDADLDRDRDRDRNRDGDTGPDEDPPANGDAPGPPGTDPPRSGEGGNGEDQGGGDGQSGGGEGNGGGEGGGSGAGDGKQQGKR
jgi:uncharacterized membrane protein YgcG